MKPSWKRVSREGVRMSSITLDTVGWYGRSRRGPDLVAEAFRFARPDPGLGQRFAGWTVPQSGLARDRTRRVELALKLRPNGWAMPAPSLKNSTCLNHLPACTRPIR